MTTDRRNIRLLQETWAAEFNGGVRILTGSAQIAISALHSENTARNRPKCCDTTKISIPL